MIYSSSCTSLTQSCSTEDATDVLLMRIELLENALRALRAEEMEPSEWAVAIIDEALWRER